MGPVLTQHEIDKLFQQARGNQEESPTHHSTPSYYKYDFRAEQKIGAERKRSLQALHGFFMRLANSSFTALLRSSPQMSLAAVNPLTYGEYVEAAPTPGCFYTVTVEELEEDFLIDLALPIAFSVVDRLLGGHGQSKVGQRELSEIEQKVVSRFIETLIEDLQKAWAKFKNLSFKIKSSAGDPQFVQLISPTEAVVIVSIAVRLLEVEDFLNFIFPVSMLEAGLPKANVANLRSIRRKEDWHRDSLILRQQMVEVPVPVVARLGQAVISFEDLMQLEQGDILTLDRLIDEPVDVLIGEEERFRGGPGLYRGHRAVRILSAIEDTEEEEPTTSAAA
jgi:flagellar motor switch protein FliM